jgi:hypothetical protein
MSGWVKLLLGVSAIAVLLSAGFFVLWLFSPPGAVGQPSCIETMPLTPVEEPGSWWEQHRHSLALPADLLNGTETYVLWNERTGDLFSIHPDDAPAVRDGWLYVGVHTRYAVLVNRRWRSDPWVLCVVGRVPDFT